MLIELVQDYHLLVPGEVVEHVPTGRRVTVYPPGICHVARLPGLYSAARAATDGGAARAVLLGDAFPLLAVCCSPPLTDRDGPLAELAADSWIRQSADPPDDDDLPDAGEDGKPSPAPTFAHALATLVAGGHRVADILHVPGVGVDGLPLPYPGWTLPQFGYHWRATLRALAGQRGEVLSATMAAIVGTFGDDDAREAVGERLRRMQAVADGRPRKTAQAKMPAGTPTTEDLDAVFPRMTAPPRPADEANPTNG